MTEPTPIRGGNIVEMLEDLLTRARAGEFVGFACVWQRPSESETGFSFAVDSGASLTAMVGGLELTKVDMMMRYHDFG